MQKRKLKGNERAARELELVELIGKATIPAEKTAYYEELYTSLRPVMYKVFSKIGAEYDYDDLWQEMYLALVGAVDIYNNPEKRKDYPFISIAMTRFHDAACHFYRRFYKTNSKYQRPVSLNGVVKSDSQGGDLEMIDTVADTTDNYEQIIDKIHADEKIKFDIELWTEVAKLPPKQADAIRERFIDERKVDGHRLSKEDAAFLHQVNEGLKKLKRNSNVRQIARIYDVLQDTSIAYNGSYKFFKEHMMSSVEHAVLLAERQEEKEAARKEKYAYRADDRQFSLKDVGVLQGRNLNKIEKATGVARRTLRTLRDGKHATYLMCQKIAEHFDRPFDELFVDTTPNISTFKARCFTMTDISILFSAGKDAIGKQVGVSGRTIANLREGKNATPEVAEKVAKWAGKPFDELFKPVGSE